LTEEEYEELDQLVQSNVLDPHAGRVQRIKLWSPSGEPVYSSLTPQTGDEHPVIEQFNKALGGVTAWGLAHEGDSRLEADLGEALEVYVPLTSEPDGPVTGVLEVYVPYGQWTDLFGSIQRTILLTMLLMALALPLAMFLLYWSAWGQIRKQRDLAIQSEQALAASEERYRSAFEDAAIGIGLVDQNRRFIQVNRALGRILGYTGTSGSRGQDCV